ncbi:RidA family protein [Georgenia ruanii]|uniref:RidA family protein n=1 Tax=Georgenia ruanii TaxID=348442 RepID=A0A7J9V338_9MICO|nr:Rid family hydrolase [Georgenia ruanii]MPV90530.1 RidA family protein [Georgenia ruanii]
MSEWFTRRSPEPPHPFPHSIASDEWVIVSGVGAHDADGELSEDAAEQARAAIGNLAAVLERSGSHLGELVWFRPYVTRREHIPAVDRVLRELLPEPRPASGALTVVELADPRMKVEFEAWAHRGARLTQLD